MLDGFQPVRGTTRERLLDHGNLAFNVVNVDRIEFWKLRSTLVKQVVRA
jgi:hypothetical protein